MVKRKVRKVTRKTKGGLFGIKVPYNPTTQQYSAPFVTKGRPPKSEATIRAQKRHIAMVRRSRTLDKQEEKRQRELLDLRRKTEVAEAKYKLRATERKARLAHPLGNLGISTVYKGKGKSKRKISWI